MCGANPWRRDALAGIHIFSREKKRSAIQPTLDARANPTQKEIAMKILLTLALLTASLFLTGCEALVVERRQVVHDGYYGGGYNRGYYGNGYYGSRPYSRSTVVVVDRRGYRPAPYYETRVVYLSDKHGRFYWSHGQKVYVRRY